MSKVLILGGTGPMGRFLRVKLASRGHDVVVSSRREQKDESGVRFVRGNAMDDHFLRGLLVQERPDAVVDFMSYGTLAFMNRRDVLLQGTTHYLFISSCRVFSDEEVHTERSPLLLNTVNDAVYLQTDDYALTKARQERLLRESGRRNWTVIRPCITYASPRLQFGCLESGTFVYRALQGLPSVIPEEMLKKKTTMLWGGDVAEIIARLVLNERAYGEDFNAVTSESHTWRKVAEIYHEAIGLEYRICSIDDYRRLCDPYQLKYGRMVDHCFDNRKVLQATGIRQQDLTPLAEGLGLELKAIREGSIRIEPDLERNGLMDRMCGTRMSLDDVPWSKRLDYYRLRYPAVDFGCCCIRKMMRRY